MKLLLFLSMMFTLAGTANTYKDVVAKFTVNYPGDWQKQDDPGKNIIAFLRPKGANDYFQENVNIVKEDISTRQMTLAIMSDILHKQALTLPGIGKFSNEKAITIAGQPGMQMTYPVDMNPLKLRVWQTWFIKGKTAYVITYTAAEDKFEKYMPQAKAILASFKFY